MLYLIMFVMTLYVMQNLLQDEMAVTGGLGDRKLNKKEVQDLKKKRDSDIVWLNERWIYNAIHPYIHEANREANWNFQWRFF